MHGPRSFSMTVLPTCGASAVVVGVVVRDVVGVVVVAASARASNALPARTTNNGDKCRDARIILANVRLAAPVPVVLCAANNVQKPLDRLVMEFNSTAGQAPKGREVPPIPQGRHAFAEGST